MLSEKIAIRVANLAKHYHIYDRPQDRLKQSIVPRLRRVLGRTTSNYYREFWALRDVSFDVRKGETVGMIGRNGSGKSTLLQIICGTLTPTMGSVETTGRVAALLELGAGFNPEFTGRENVLLNAAILGFPAEEMLARMEMVLEFSELGEFLDQPVKTYSSGMYARLAFSASIHVDPEILIVDETLAVGDARFVAKCFRRINEIKAQGATVLFVSHDVSSVRTLCDRAIWLDRGRVVDYGDVFPVSGRYMEFIFQDDETREEKLQEEISAQQKDATPERVALVSAGKSAITTVAVRENAPPGQRQPGDLVEEPVRPSVTHWGSHKGIILSASVRDAYGVRKDVHRWAAKTEVVIDVCVPVHIPRDHLSVAFGIKDLKGTDLIVSTTHDFGRKRLPDAERFTVSFRLTNWLVTGKYLLVAAVENREHRDIHYFEYIEGAHYFSSLSDERLFGVFQPRIEQLIVVA